MSENISLYTKLPSWFKVPTPLGTYNPDWAIMYNKGDGDQLYFVTESKGTTINEFLKPIELGKIKCGKAHFESIGSRMIRSEERRVGKESKTRKWPEKAKRKA